MFKHRRLNYLLLTFAISLPNTVFAQTTVTATICNSKKQPISFTNIVLLKIGNIGTATDEKGMFRLSGLKNNDTLKISNVAYQSRLIAVKSLAEGDTIILQDASTKLSQVTIKPHQLKQKNLGYLNFKHKAFFALQPGSQLATLIENPGNTGWISGVYFSIKSKGDCKNGIRIRVMKVDQRTLKPLDDLLHENIIVNADELKSDDYIDLSRYDIELPKDGVYIVLEWLEAETRCDQKSYTVIAGNMALYNDVLWFNYRDRKWFRSPRPKGVNGACMTPNVGIRIAYN